ncbi:MAG: LPS assembly protein LptD [Paracoccaceae bacterium]
MRRLLFSALLGLTLVAAPQFAPAQELPALLADSIIINPDNSLTASGQVDVLYKGSRLNARRITYDPRTDRLEIEGPLTLDDGKGAVVLASSADLAADLRDGILKSARLVLADQMQLATDRMERTDGRYTHLSRVTASSCQVCASRPTPLWEIRARSVTHDQLEQQIYYDQAQFRIAGVPVFYVPRLRMPDPNLDRSTGFLLPVFRSSTNLGFGVKQPYFITLGPSRDLTFAPYVASLGARALYTRYRQAFANGAVEFNAGIARDRVLPGDPTRTFLLGQGNFSLGHDYTTGFQLETASDSAVLLDYGVTEKDRLASGLFLTRTKRDLFFDARFFHYNSLRAGDDNAVLPSLVGNLSFARRVTPQLIGGQGLLTFDVQSLRRTSSVTTDANLDGVTDGRDVTRFSLGASWQRQNILAGGLIFGTTVALNSDLFLVRQDAGFASTITRTVPSAAVELRWPWLRSHGPGRPTEVIEPVVQLLWSPDRLRAVPNEDSAQVELDEGNLFSFSRFPGMDVREQGLRANIGVNYSRLNPKGWTLRATAGRILRQSDLGQFSTGSSLTGTRSDWLLAAQVEGLSGLTLTNRALFDDQFSFSKDELRLAFDRPRYGVDATYVWLVASPAEGRPNPTAELALNGRVQLSEGWKLQTAGRYDFNSGKPIRAGAGVEFSNECAIVDLSLSRRFTSSTTVKADTEFSLEIHLNGFGAGSGSKNFVRSCGR